MPKNTTLKTFLTRLPLVLALLYAADRALKLLAVARFFRRAAPPAPEEWPAVTLIQPVTRATHDLQATLRTRAALDYPAPQQHLLVCDVADTASQALVRALMAKHPRWSAQLILAPPDDGVLASKITKITTALPHATGAAYVCVDDDIALRPDALRILIPPLFQPGVGATFGVACYTNWSNAPSALMSAFVNANALLSYIPLTWLAEPFTITGHCFALRRTVWDAAGGMERLQDHFGDDHEMARRVRALRLRAEQTPLIYDVDNTFPTLAAFHAQMRRWFVMPRMALVPFMTRREQAASTLGSAGNLIVPLLLGLALLRRNRAGWSALASALLCFAGGYAWCERAVLKRSTPLGRWPLVLAVALFGPLEVIAGLLAGDTIEWRGRRLRLIRGGTFEVLS
ncbi:hypothetical protein SE17_17990 [Kouleothrix aurantiaca]|uniref:Glycosyltransferase n=1 Tax=Kouleothrix aurantiaca TaxID=186479 RepID=A0A0P9FFY8_9CHLR|nr:hypothetical protein SE17_17990 [Kouleothrix aurantiaca]